MKEKSYLIDIDGILAHTIPHLILETGLRLGQEPLNRPADPDLLHTLWPDIAPHRVMRVIRDIASDPFFIMRIPPNLEARRPLQKLHEERRLYGYISLRYPDWKTLTQDWLTAYRFPMPCHVLFVEDKHEAMSALDADVILVDDNPETVKPLGKRGILFDRDYNRDVPARQRIHSLEELV